MTGLYLVAVVLIAFLPRTTSITIRVQGALTDIIEGFQYLRRETILIIILLFVIVIFLLSFPYMMMLPIFTEDILNVGATGLGVLMSVSGVGAIASSLTLASLPNRKRGAMLLASSLILGVALVGFSFSSSWPLSLGIIIIVGLGQSGRMALANTLLQYYSDDEHRGRVMSIFNLDIGLSAITTFAAGLMAETVGVQWAIGGFATVLIFLTILTLVFVPRLRRLD
jgi:MFS family permease